MPGAGVDVRLLETADLRASWELTRLSFGQARDAPAGWLTDRPGRSTWGVFDTSGRLLAKAMDRQQQHWFGGRAVPATGIAGVATAPDARGRGLARAVLTRLLGAARERGAVLATLFRTSPAPYRRLGFEEVGRLTWTTLPTATLAGALAGVRPPDGVTLRAAEPADVAAVAELYRAVARAGTGYLERSGPLVDTTPDGVLRAHDGLTLAVGPGGVEGYASWDRGPGYDADARLTVPDLIATTPDATTALLAVLASWASVTPTLALRLPDPDPATLLAPMVGARVESTDPWMLRLVDAAGAVAARGWPPHLRAEVRLDLTDDECPWNAGRHRLVLDGGVGVLERARGSEPSPVRVGPRGLAVLYAGAASPAVLRRTGLLAGGDAGTDAVLQAAGAGPAPTLLDYF